ncbi:MAG: RNA polymerase sigma-54 factor, partial [Ignavibacteria bacterium]|nr:RNA polymerase sigma-54 factor [Ignavibacteria bacterium]
MLTLSQKLQQQLKLLPQQIQYQKLLQLNNLALELRIKNELDINPLLEEIPEEELTLEQMKDEKEADEFDETETETVSDDEYTFEDFLNDNPEDPHAGYTFEPEEQIDIPAPDKPSLRDKLISQLQLLDLD